MLLQPGLHEGIGLCTFANYPIWDLSYAGLPQMGKSAHGLPLGLAMRLMIRPRGPRMVGI